MSRIEVVAHRGVHGQGLPRAGSLPALEHAARLGADAVEFDVRLTRDRVPVVFHHLLLQDLGGLPGILPDYTLADLRAAGPSDTPVPTLREVLIALGPRIALEIEIKGPEPEAAELVARDLREHPNLWSRIEVTSGEPVILRELRDRCPGLALDFLHPLREPWMTPAVDLFLAIERARLAGARAVHLHATQLTSDAVVAVRSRELGVHAWGINDRAALDTALELGITRVCTDQLALIQSFLRSSGGRGA